jgi:p-aminobenzoyl-glutamate transporter AbgT
MTTSVPGTVTPLLAWFAVKRLVLDPYQARKREQEQQRRREANREKVAEARREALAAASLMAERFKR